MKFGVLMMALCALAGSGCGNEAEPDPDCEVELNYLGTANDRVECAESPVECGDSAGCDAPNVCIAALYELCAPPAFGVACSEGPTGLLISCNE